LSDEVFDHTHPELPRGIHLEVPEHRERPEFSRWWVGGWLSPGLVIAFTIGWTLMIYGLIGNRPRTWQYGAAPYVPGESFASIQRVPPGPPPEQVELPYGTDDVPTEGGGHETH